MKPGPEQFLPKQKARHCRAPGCYRKIVLNLFTKGRSTVLLVDF